MRRLLPMLLLASASPATAAEDGLDALLARLARPAPAEIAFLELRDSPLLQTPTRTAGVLSRPREGVLVKRVAHPFAETTTIAEAQVQIEREGERPRRFALSRAPELEGLLASFDALLGADRARLERHYRIDFADGEGDWAIALSPRDPRLSRRIVQVLLRGRDDTLRCMELSETSGARTTTVLGEASATLAQAPVEQVRAHCREGAAP